MHSKKALLLRGRLGERGVTRSSGAARPARPAAVSPPRQSTEEAAAGLVGDEARQPGHVPLA
eukprot:CAMPEP_0206263374 /NCGR_PEP_ID=MMETSP0047_2-20121206/28783_1 /ASSEMBLY_ACC=CAM_ASM_000192 /TAXON_ID=195065 /ORGANISM="Chroomonas mesostigmatica_cf, Strain CCMP1168" /LENGTH=61 /DNA_ID=CAMNT_0053690909 /DNA_START=87 /DNA_END=272 /DNA_ORIENTATION=+